MSGNDPRRPNGGRQSPNGARPNHPNRQGQPRRRPTPEELRRREAARREAERRKAYEKEMRRRERKRNRQVFFGRFIVFLIVLAILLCAAGIIFLLMFNRTPHEDPDSGKIRYFYGGDEVRAEDAENCIVDGTPFLCFNDLADYVGMAESGSAWGLKFLIPDEGGVGDSSGTGREEYVIFPTNEKEADINGQTIRIDGINRIIGEEVWVSLDFISEYMRGLSAVYNSDRGEVRVSRLTDDVLTTEEKTVYLPVEFTLKPVVSMENIPESDIPGETGENTGDDEPVYELDFINDLSEYEKYMNPEDRDVYLTLVNTVNLLDQSYTPSDLVDCKYTAQGRNTQQLRLYANKALEALMKEMQAEGFYNMAVYSGFRSYSYQNMLFNQYTENELAKNPNLSREQAEQIVLTYSTRPGTSEHQTGLAVDMDTLGTFSTDFEYEPEYAWLQENAWKFGFILRFPKNKTDITTIQFEPWHYRYVGRYHAKKIYNLGLCLEEYVEMWKNGSIS
ncbi:MAG: D-alanyl-D-alanine carboxypeptidase family protein [Ruminococcaceae bacterium]|nr:D-alanyl-D-alanine carboxypeptidase family protein [Oscillospiraceae bacterium]